jgi:hypothetical protein
VSKESKAKFRTAAGLTTAMTIHQEVLCSYPIPSWNNWSEGIVTLGKTLTKSILETGGRTFIKKCVVTLSSSN